ncbi:MAG: DUF2088 domain-containing protein [Clostridia bacterium]|jgi:hypothetical protein|nr:DUF2088 domain-containing protein [Clostridia bacterium]MBT7122666.1 DUF2088 domain-containing protein [Clostridia bacterium]
MIHDLLGKVHIPELFETTQSFARPLAGNLDELLRGKLAERANIKAGQTIAITVGSRGIAGYREIVDAITEFVRSKGASAVLVPAMGSHGGGTFDGQKAVLGKLGITDTLGEIVPFGEEVKLGESKHGKPVYISKAFLDADGVIILNRVKPHTSFRGEYESGIVKMAAIGMGGAKGARTTHAAGYMKMAENIAVAANTIFEKVNVVCAVATVENAYGEVASIDVVRKSDIMHAEPELLKKAWALMPKLPFDKLDVLIVDEIGKDISGTGMDTNIIGRYHTRAAFGGPDINKIVVLDLSEKSGGNANGVGLADFTTKRLFDKIDYASTYLNVLTSTEPNSAKIPPVMDTDELAIKAALFTCNQSRAESITMMRIRNTKDITNIEVSKNLL